MYFRKINVNFIEFKIFLTFSIFLLQGRFNSVKDPFFSASWRKVMTGTQTWHELGVRSWCGGHEGMLLTGVLIMACLSFFLICVYTYIQISTYFHAYIINICICIKTTFVHMSMYIYLHVFIIWIFYFVWGGGSR